MNLFIYDGKHLMCDILTEEITNLNDPSKITSCLESIVETLDMTMIFATYYC